MDSTESELLDDDDTEQLKLHKCTYDNCSAAFSRPWRLAAHINTHTGERPFVCSHPNCDRRYMRSQHLKRHIATSHEQKLYNESFKCPKKDCGKEYPSSYSLRRHYKRAHEIPSSYKCETCGAEFRKRQTLLAHTYSHTGVKPFECKYTDCKDTFATIKDLNRHHRCHSLYNCPRPDCLQSFGLWSQLQKHLKTHPTYLTCGKCYKNFKTPRNLRIHSQVHEEMREVFYCPFRLCVRSFYFERNLRQHIKLNHSGKAFYCEFENCGKKISTKQKLSEHMKLHNKDVTVKPQKANLPRKPRKDKGLNKPLTSSVAMKLCGVLSLDETESVLDGATSEDMNDNTTEKNCLSTKI